MGAAQLLKDFQRWRRSGPFIIDLGRLFALEQQVQQVVVRQGHQVVKPLGLSDGNAPLELFEKALDEEVVFQQTASATPPQARQAPFVKQFLG